MPQAGAASRFQTDHLALPDTAAAALAAIAGGPSDTIPGPTPATDLPGGQPHAVAGGGAGIPETAVLPPPPPLSAAGRGAAAGEGVAGGGSSAERSVGPASALADAFLESLGQEARLPHVLDATPSPSCPVPVAVSVCRLTPQKGQCTALM